MNLKIMETSVRQSFLFNLDNEMAKVNHCEIVLFNRILRKDAQKH